MKGTPDGFCPSRKVLPVSNLVPQGGFRAAPISRTRLGTSLRLTCLPNPIYPGTASPATRLIRGLGPEAQDDQMGVGV